MDQVRFGIVGFGAMGLEHARIMLSRVPEARLAAVATRNERHIAALRGLPGGGQVHFVPLPWISVSASRIRHRWLHGLNVDFLVPKPVLELLDAHRKTVLAHWLPEAKTDDA